MSLFCVILLHITVFLAYYLEILLFYHLLDLALNFTFFVFLCQVIVVKPVDVMCNRYGSHVLRSLLCLCKGMPLDSSQEFHVTKSSTILAERFNTMDIKFGGNSTPHLQRGFPDLLKFLVTGMVECARKEIATLQIDQYSSLVLQVFIQLIFPHDIHLSYLFHGKVNIIYSVLSWCIRFLFYF